MKKKILLALVAPFFAFALSAAGEGTMTQQEAQEIVLERLSQETRLYNLHVTKELQKEMRITSSAGELLELNYWCWVFYIHYTDTDRGRYLIVKEANGRILEVDAQSDLTPGNLAEWKQVIGSQSGCEDVIICRETFFNEQRAMNERWQQYFLDISKCDSIHRQNNNYHNIFRYCYHYHHNYYAWVQVRGIVDDCLTLRIHSRGCNPDSWVVKMIDAGYPIRPYPGGYQGGGLADRFHVILSLDKKEDGRINCEDVRMAEGACCDAYAYKDVTFNLQNLRVEGANTVHIHGFHGSVYYTGFYCTYRY
jgi:hypothetical protein